MRRQTGRFQIKTDDGRIVEVLQYTEFISTDNFEGTGELEGFTSFWTNNGTRVNRLSPDDFEIVAPTPIRAKRI